MEPSEEIQFADGEFESNILFNNLIEITEEKDQQGQQQQQLNPVSQKESS